MSKPLAAMAVSIAKGKIGEKEATGKNDGVFVEAVQDFIDGESDFMRGQPWCAAFASWCIYRAGDALKIPPLVPKSGSSTSFVAWLSKNKLMLPRPEANCLGFLKGDGGTPGKTHHHTFFVESVDGDYVVGIDGNWHNAVSKTRHAIKDCDFGEIV